MTAASVPPAFAAMARYEQFILYRTQPSATRPGKTDKFPVDWRSGVVVNAHDATMWTDAATAMTAAELWGAPYGVGFVFTEADPFWFLDIDECLTPAGWSPLAVELCYRLPGAAVEISLSGKGLHLFGSGTVPPHGCKNVAQGIELYTSGRFAALTFNGAQGDSGLDLSTHIAPIVAQYFSLNDGAGPIDNADWTTFPCQAWGGPDEDDALIEMMLSAGTSAQSTFAGRASLRDLWEGNDEALARTYPDPNRAYDASSADAALAQHLAFWTGKQCDRMERLMRRSALAREKWDTRADYYLPRTILRANSVQGDRVYQGKRTLTGHLAPGAVVPAVGDWPPLVTLDAPELPRLAADCLPAWAGAFAAALSTATETPEELSAAMVLAACSTAAARRFRVLVKPGYFEPCNLWIAAALPPANRKSAVQIAACRPLLDWDRDWAAAMADEIKRITSAVKTAEARAKALREKAGRQTDVAAANELARQAADIEATMQEIPKPPQLWSSDVTPERLGVILADNKERMAWLSSEGGLFEILGGRYSNGVPNLDLFLKAHSGDPERVDRGSRPPAYLRHPLLTVGLSPQPDVLRGLATKPGFRGRGLLGRFLYLLPPSPVGYRTLSTPPVPDATASAYAAGLRAMLDIPAIAGSDGEDHPHLLRLSDGALNLWMAFAREMESAMRPGGEFETLTDWAGKAPGAAARIAGVLHAIEHSHGQPAARAISEDTMHRTLQIMAVISQHSVAALDLMGADETIAAARKVWQWVQSGRHRAFSVNEAFNALKGSFPRVASLREALGALVERGYLEIVESERTGHAGRPPSPTVTVRPDLVTGW